MIMSFLMSNIVPLIFLAVFIIAVSYFIPFEGYKLSVQFSGIVLLVAFVFLAGKANEREYWKNQVAEAELEIAYLTAESEKINTKIITQYVDRVKEVEKVREIKTTEFVTKTDDSKCTINEGFVTHYNSIVAGTKTTPSATDRNTSAVTLSDVAETDKINLSNALINIEHIKALQKWIREQQELFKSK